MNIREYTASDFGSVVALVSEFRVAISSIRGPTRRIDLDAAAEELQEYVDKEYPVFVAETDRGELVGYLVCRTDGDTVWAESLYVSPPHRRRGIAGMLYDAAEQVSTSRGGGMPYNWVHPTNDSIISFLRNRGYDVLNLIEIRRPYPEERTETTLKIGDHDYRY